MRQRIQRSPRTPGIVLFLAFALPACCAFSFLAGLVVYNLPAVNERLAWRVDVLRSQVRSVLFPHADTVPTPSIVVEAVSTIVLPTVQPSVTPTGIPDTPIPATETPVPVPPTPVPGTAALSGVRHEYQKYNNCGPATLAMYLSYWGWPGSQKETAAYLKPVQEDRNVMPYEIQEFVSTQTGLQSTVRFAGDLEALKRLVAAGFPVMIEKGFLPDAEKGWMGHYALVTGYDDAASALLTQDSYLGPNYRFAYAELEENWRAFNYTYIVVFPPERRGEVESLVGADMDDAHNASRAAQRAMEETGELTGQNLAFAWYNLGTSLNALGDYDGAAKAFDRARVTGLPWRMLWYQTGPYRAYYQTGRHQEVIDLATATLGTVDNLEESYYWRGLAKQALGNLDGAVQDWQTALRHNPNFEAAAQQLDALGVAH